MAYVKSSATETLSKHTKKIITVVAAVLAVILVVVVAYFVNPQNFTELLLPDKTYAELVVAKNGKQAGKSLSEVTEVTGKDRAVSGSGNLQFVLNDYAIANLGGEDIAGTVEDYLNTTSFDISAKKIQQDMQLNLSWKDSTSTLLDLDYINVENCRYFNFEQFDLGWLKSASDSKGIATLSGQLQDLLTTEDETRQKAVKSAATDAFKEMSEGLDYRVDKELTLTVGEKTATGDRINMLADEEDINLFVDTFFASLLASEQDSEWAEKEQALQERLTAFLTENGVSKLSLDLYVNSRNVVCGMDLIVKCDTDDLTGSVILVDDQEAGVSGYLRSGDTVLLSLEQTRGDAEGNGVLELISGQLAVQVTYENLQVTESGNLTGRFVTSAFAVPNHKSWGNCIVELVLSEDNGVLTVGGSLNSEQAGSFILNLSLAEDDVGVIMAPDEDEVSKLKSKKLSKAATTYFFSTLPEENENYNEVYKNIINTVYKNLLSSAVNASKLKS